MCPMPISYSPGNMFTGNVCNGDCDSRIAHGRRAATAALQDTGLRGPAAEAGPGAGRGGGGGEGGGAALRPGPPHTAHRRLRCARTAQCLCCCTACCRSQVLRCSPACCTAECVHLRPGPADCSCKSPICRRAAACNSNDPQRPQLRGLQQARLHQAHGGRYLQPAGPQRPRCVSCSAPRKQNQNLLCLPPYWHWGLHAM